MKAMKENINDLITFLAVVKEGSFTRAAIKADTSQSSVSQIVKNLEESLQLKLLNRTTRSLTLTEAGERLVQLIGPPIEEISAGLNLLLDLRDKPAGRVRISADEYAIQQIIWPKLSPVIKKFPDIHIELITDYDLVDITKEGFDAGVRRGGLIAQNMMALPISEDQQMAIVVSPRCLSNYVLPKKPEDLLTLPCINLQLSSYGKNLAWHFLVDGKPQKICVTGQLVLNEINQVHQASLDDYGFAFLPKALVQNDILSGRLTTVLDEFNITYPKYYLYYSSRLKPSSAFNIIIEALRHKNKDIADDQDLLI